MFTIWPSFGAYDFAARKRILEQMSGESLRAVSATFERKEAAHEALNEALLGNAPGAKQQMIAWGVFQRDAPFNDGIILVPTPK